MELTTYTALCGKAQQSASTDKVVLTSVSDNTCSWYTLLSIKSKGCNENFNLKNSDSFGNTHLSIIDVTSVWRKHGDGQWSCKCTWIYMDNTFWEWNTLVWEFKIGRQRSTVCLLVQWYLMEVGARARPSAHTKQWVLWRLSVVQTPNNAVTHRCA